MTVNETYNSDLSEDSLPAGNASNWHFKALENMQMHLAYIDLSDEIRVIFTNTIGHCFEEITFQNEKIAYSFLRNNGFKSCTLNGHFMKLFSLPSSIEKHEWYQQKVYSF